MNFPTTQWTLLAGATLHGDTAAVACLGEFYQRYHAPIHAAVLGRGMRGEEARDITQGFFAHLMEHGTLRRANEGKGRFRCFLYGALKRYMADQYDRATAARRGGGVATVPLNGSEADEPQGGGAADAHAFDYDWAMAILQRALAVVEQERSPQAFAAVKAFLPGSPAIPTGAGAAAEAGMSETALRTEVSRVRLRLRAIIREEVSRTVSAPHETDEEMAYLFEVLCRGGSSR